MKTLHEALPYREGIFGVGLDSAEKGHPPAKFKAVFDAARAAGFRAVAHAGEEGPPASVRSALEHLPVARIDHGNRALEDPDPVLQPARRQRPLTLCPPSTLGPRVVDDRTTVAAEK